MRSRLHFRRNQPPVMWCGSSRRCRLFCLHVADYEEASQHGKKGSEPTSHLSSILLGRHKDVRDKLSQWLLAKLEARKADLRQLGPQWHHHKGLGRAKLCDLSCIDCFVVFLGVVHGWVSDGSAVCWRHSGPSNKAAAACSGPS